MRATIFPNNRKRFDVTIDYFLEKSEECFALSRKGRELAEQLDAMGQSFMAKAVELDTNADRLKNQSIKNSKS